MYVDSLTRKGRILAAFEDLVEEGHLRRVTHERGSGTGVIFNSRNHLKLGANNPTPCFVVFRYLQQGQEDEKPEKPRKAKKSEEEPRKAKRSEEKQRGRKAGAPTSLEGSEPSQGGCVCVCHVPTRKATCKSSWHIRLRRSRAAGHCPAPAHPPASHNAATAATMR